jgi:NAD-dependent SIR2 family protein deacetylase
MPSDVTGTSFSKGAARAAELIACADALVIAAGAGLGVDSGLPDFRGHEGLWSSHTAPAGAHLEFRDVANPKTFLSDPAMAWGLFGHNLSMYRKTQPHAGYGILKIWSGRAYLGARIFTSNVDGQFQKAGFLPKQMHECHGSIHHLQCIEPCKSGVWSADAFSTLLVQENCLLLNEPPKCPVCGGLARPNILMFGDSGWLSDREQMQSRAKAKWFRRLAAIEANAVVIEIGAGSARTYVRHFSDAVSWKYGARMIRINPRESEVPCSDDVGITAEALEALLAIDSLLEKWIPKVVA